MASYKLALTESAVKELNRLPGSAVARIMGRIEKLADNPRPGGCQKLKGVIQAIEDNTKTVDVTSIAHRKEAYQP